jgi:hypothetical protein
VDCAQKLQVLQCFKAESIPFSVKRAVRCANIAFFYLFGLLLKFSLKDDFLGAGLQVALGKNNHPYTTHGNV